MSLLLLRVSPFFACRKPTIAKRLIIVSQAAFRIYVLRERYKFSAHDHAEELGVKEEWTVKIRMGGLTKVVFHIHVVAEIYELLDGGDMASICCGMQGSELVCIPVVHL